MIIDGLLRFTGTSGGATGGITSTAGADAPTTGTQTASNVIDLGVTSGVPSSANGGGARDLSSATRTMRVMANVVTAFTGGTSLQMTIAGAPDNGSGAQGSYTTMYTSPAVTEANLVAGMRIADIDLPRPVPGQVLPRFLRVQFISVGTHGAGTIEVDLVLDRDDQVIGVGGVLSGYPAGINIAN